MGTVLLAEDPRLERLVALKTFTGPEARFSQGRDQLLREARAAAAITHPNIAGVHDVLDVGGEVVIVFEYVEGVTLAERLRRGRLSVGEVLRISEQLADGLSAAHARGVIHRDLKPSNVMLAADGRVKILDFGVARSLGGAMAESGSTVLTTTGAFGGTPAYAAPEQWLNEPLGGQADLYALGVVMFEMLGGQRPFDAPSRLTLMQQVLEAPRPRIRELNGLVPASLDALIDQAMAREANQRPGSAREMAGIIRSIEHDVVSASSPPDGPTRRRWVAWVTGAAAVLVAAIVALVVMLQTPPSAPVEPRQPVVAVLPFTNATDSAANDYLAAGVTDSLTTSLASVGGVTVLSRAAVLEASRRQPDPAQLAKDLGVTYLVEGSVQQSKDVIRYLVNLVRPDRSLAWADTAEGRIETIFALQARMATALSLAMSVQLSATDRARLAEQPTSNADALAAYWRGRALLDRSDVKGNAEAALMAFEEAVRLDPKFAIAQAATGEALWVRYFETRDAQMAQRAIDAATTALRLDPDRANVRYALAVSLAGTGKLDEAIEELQRALALRQNYDDARQLLGNILARKGRVEEALAEYDKAIAVRPNYWQHYNTRGVSLLQAGRYAEAAESFRRVIDLQPDSFIGFAQLGSAYYMRGDRTSALAQYQLAIERGAPPAIYTNVGAIYHLERDYQKAVDAYRRVLEVQPNEHVTHRNLGDALGRLGQTREAEASYTRAVELARSALTVNPNDAESMSALAVYTGKLHQTSESLKWARAAEAIAPEEPRVLLRVATAFTLAGDHPAALRALRVAVGKGLGPDLVNGQEELAPLRKYPEFQQMVDPR
jgi:tetratricopeptide (TPR) repeat protein